jgi:hypothetical protein
MKIASVTEITPGLQKIINDFPTGESVQQIYPLVVVIQGENRTNDTVAHLTKLYNSHDLYNKHSLYLGRIDPSDNSPMMGCVENSSPTLYSIINE